MRALRVCVAVGAHGRPAAVVREYRIVSNSCSIVRRASRAASFSEGLIDGPERLAMDVLSDVLRAVRLTSALYFEISASRPWIAATLSMKDIGATMMPGRGPRDPVPRHGVRSRLGEARRSPRAGRETSSRRHRDVPARRGALAHVRRDRWEAPPARRRLLRRGRQERRSRSRFARSDGEWRARELRLRLPRLRRVAVQSAARRAAADVDREAAARQRCADEGAPARRARAEGERQSRARRRSSRARASSCSCRRSASTWTRCPRARRAGSRACATSRSAARCGSSTRSPRPTGRSRASRKRAACRARCSPSASRASRASRRCATSAVGGCRSRRALLTDGESIGRVADGVGYRSEAAFQRAFKKFVGVTCGEWRKRTERSIGAEA